jgi:L-ascorbate metabolism protein UlaG (beta-lactamase superfamily)
MLEKLKWLGHATFKLNLEKIVYIDPWKIKDGESPADIILISHSHYDHLSVEDIDKIRTENTRIFASEDAVEKLEIEATAMKPGDSATVDNIEIIATPAYNIGKEFHPQENSWLGFIIKSPEGSLYYAGDTDLIPEFDQVTKHAVDIALLPVGGTYTMRPREAAEAAEIIKPALAIPYHYGDIVGTAADARRFISAYSGQSSMLTPEH